MKRRARGCAPQRLPAYVVLVFLVPLVLYYACLFEVLCCDVFGVFLVEVYLPVQLAHRLHVEAGRDFVQDLFDLRVLLEARRS